MTTEQRQNLIELVVESISFCDRTLAMLEDRRDRHFAHDDALRAGMVVSKTGWQLMLEQLILDEPE